MAEHPTNDPVTRFVKALAAKDRPGMLDVLDPAVDFRALTPGKFWESSSAVEVVDSFVLGAWFEPKDEIAELLHVETGEVGGRGTFGYQVRVTNPEGTFVVEQQGYLDVVEDRIAWLRLICSGYRRIESP